MPRTRATHPYRATLLLLLAAQTACGAGWTSTVVSPRTRFPEDRQVQVWMGDGTLRWHAVRITDSTVTGVFFLEPADCDSCRVSVPRAEVDSLRVGNPELGVAKSAALAPAIMLGIAFGACFVFGGCPFEGGR